MSDVGTLPLAWDPTGGAHPAGEPFAGVVETHTSVVLLLGGLAYKLKKPVRLPFVDLSTVERRQAVCEDEVRLNRRFAPDVYLGVGRLQPPAPTTATAGSGSRVTGEPVVVMRRMPVSRRLSSLVLQGPSATAVQAVGDVARQVAAAHGALEPLHDVDLWGTTAALWEEGADQLAAFEELLATGADPGGVERVRGLAREYLAGRRGLLDGRVRAGLVRDGHGDLLADDVFVLDDGPRILDCLEFDRRLRVGDVLADVAFLAMDLEALGAVDLADHLVRTWCALSGEEHPASLEHHYVAYRAFVRCKVQCLRHAQGDPQAGQRARRLLALCHNRLQRGRVHLVLVGGLPGTGKTTLCRAVAGADLDRDWTVLSSDVVRKQSAGLAPQQHAAAPFRQGLYEPARTAATYAALLDRAEVALRAGTCVLLDASWTDAELRGRAVDLADRTGSHLTQIRCTAPRPVCLERLAGRSPAGGSASDADAAVHDALARAEDPWPQARTITTTTEVDRAVAAVLRAVDGPGSRQPAHR